MDNGFVKVLIAVVIGFFVIKTCSNTGSSSSNAWQKSPLDNFIRDYANDSNFVVILHDMDVDDPTIGSTKYMHKYQIITERSGAPEASITDWYTVTDEFFNKNVDNMGMELLSKKDGVLHKNVAPAGYSNYIGNERYGSWQHNNGSSFWQFYGQYAFMSSMFNLMSYPARRSYWNDYRGGYYGSSRPYYGPNGSRMYGTQSYSKTNAGKKSSWGSKSSTFKSQVRNRVQRSASTTKRNRISRSSSRSRSSSSFRSRSGGFGK